MKPLKSSPFKKSIATLVAGTGIAQSIPVLISPVLTRIYTPSEFGIIAIFISLVSICAVFVTGRYEQAIVLPSNEDEVNPIVRLSARILFSTIMLIFFLVFIFGVEISNYLETPELKTWLYLLPIAVFLTGVNQILVYLLIRKKNFTRLAKNKVLVSTSNAGGQLLGGKVLMGSQGLFVGYHLGLLASVFGLLGASGLREKLKQNRFSEAEIALKYKKFPLYDIPSSLLSVVSNQMPLLVIGKYFGSGVLGLYSFTYKILMMPVNILSKSVLDVFKQKATEDFNKEGSCRGVFVKTLVGLVAIGLIPFSILLILGPQLFALVFGEQWQEAGRFAQILTPMLFMKFIVNPLSYTFYIAQKQNIDFLFQTLLLALTLVALVIGVISESITVTLVSFTVSSCIIYLIYLFFSFRYSGGLSAQKV